MRCFSGGRGSGRLDAAESLAPLLRCDPAVPEFSAFRTAAFTIVAAGVAALYYGQIVLVPVALSVLLTFLCTPVVRLFERFRLGRLVSVLTVGVLLYSALAMVLWIIAVQGAALVAALPQYRANIAQKIEDVRGLGLGGALERLQETWKDATRESRKGGPDAASKTAEPLVVTRDTSWSAWNIPGLLGSWVSPLGTLALVAVLVPFMLLERGSLTDR